MSNEAWTSSFVRCLGVQLHGGKIDVDEHGEEISGDHLLLLFNADHANKIPFTLPHPKDGQPWELLLDTARPDCQWEPRVEGAYDLEPCSMAVFCSKLPKEGEGA